MAPLGLRTGDGHTRTPSSCDGDGRSFGSLVRGEPGLDCTLDDCIIDFNAILDSFFVRKNISFVARSHHRGRSNDLHQPRSAPGGAAKQDFHSSLSGAFSCSLLELWNLEAEGGWASV